MMAVSVAVVFSLAYFISNLSWKDTNYTPLKPVDSDEEEAEPLGDYQKEVRRKLTCHGAEFANDVSSYTELLPLIVQAQLLAK